MSEVVLHLRASFPDRDWLAAEQVAACLKLGRSQICHLCSTDVFPLNVEVHQGQVRVGLDELAKFLDADSVPMSIGDGTPGGDLLLTRLFQAQLRAEIYRLELDRAIEALVRIVDELAVDPEAVDVLCRSQFELAKVVLRAQARGLATGLSDLVVNTAPAEQPLAAMVRAKTEFALPSAAE